MKISKYTIDNWRVLLEKDWEYLRQDTGSANMENIVDKLLSEISGQLDEVIDVLTNSLKT